MATDREKEAEAIARALRALAGIDSAFALVVYVPNASAPLFFATDPPPDGIGRLRAAVDAIAKAEGLTVVDIPTEH